ncbi:hypothetical protein PV768_19965 [Pseudarthrobacter sp. CC4]|nr:hypothetical protein [Pseudarthrobacter oxydans]WPU07789.1 hypothetical protein SMD14_11355 [Pseudarthrobacter oxydans]
MGIEGYGILESRSPKPLGSVLPEREAKEGRNFVGNLAHVEYLARRKQGWGVDPVRCLQYLTSSQTLTINLLASLKANPTWLLACFSKLLHRDDLLTVRACAIEYAPASPAALLGDRTRVDTLIEFETEAGILAVVVEVKYTDRMNSRKIAIHRNERYIELGVSTSLWTDQEGVLNSTTMNRLARCHALGMAYARQSQGSKYESALVVVHHAADLAATSILDEYGESLDNPSGLAGFQLSDFVSAMASTAPSAAALKICDELRVRYASESVSESLWQEFLQECDLMG